MMLSEIYIKNYILVPELRLRFGPGLTVITGETGAGKSILVGSVALIFGESAQGLEPFDSGKPIYLETSFIPPQDEALQEYLEQINAAWEDELVLSREISAAGKSSYYIGGRKVSAQVMKTLKSMLLDFHHQRDQQKLLNAAYQLEILDRFAGTTQLCKDFGSAYRDLKKNQQTLQEMLRQEALQQQKVELYRYQYEELEKAGLKENEDIALQQEFELQSHSKEIMELAQGINTALFEAENSIFDRLSFFEQQLQRFHLLSRHIEDASSSILEAREALKESSFALSALLDNFSFDPSRLSSIETRLDLINSLLHKHKVSSISELLILFQEREKEIAVADDFQQQIAALKQELTEAEQVLAEKATKLSDLRHKAAVKLAKELQGSIRALALDQARLQIEIDKKACDKKVISDALACYSESGQDTVEFLFSANAGTLLKPLSQVASGGELSRILLGIKQVLAQRISPKLLILDEIDSGVGGKTADLMASAIADIAKVHPVLCITHLAQIAAIANTHVAVEKVGDTKTSVSLRVLEAKDRIHELARMLSGHITEHSLKHAEELAEKNMNKRGLSE